MASLMVTSLVILAEPWVRKDRIIWDYADDSPPARLSLEWRTDALGLRVKNPDV